MPRYRLQVRLRCTRPNCWFSHGQPGPQRGPEDARRRGQAEQLGNHACAAAGGAGEGGEVWVRGGRAESARQRRQGGSNGGQGAGDAWLGVWRGENSAGFLQKAGAPSRSEPARPRAEDARRASSRQPLARRARPHSVTSGGTRKHSGGTLFLHHNKRRPERETAIGLG